MEQINKTRARTRLTLPIAALVVVWFITIACGDEDGEGASFQSDSVSGGDLAALQYKQGELICGCPEEGRDFCLSISWPEGQVECFRNAYNAYVDANRDAYECAVRIVKDSIECWQAAGCDGAARDVCARTFSETFEECPKFDAQTQAESQTCVGGE